MTGSPWRPSPRAIDEAHVSRLMRSLGHAVLPDDPEAHARSVRAFVAETQRRPEWFWKACVEDLDLEWSRPWERVVDTSKGNEWADWFVGGELNIVDSCVTRHARGTRAGERALVAETEDGTVREFTFTEVADRVHRVAALLRDRGIGPGDTVACYMPMVAEVVFAMLGTMQVGAIFIPIFSGYAPPAVRERLEDAEVKLLFTADGSMRRGRPFSLKEGADLAVAGSSTIETVVVLRRVGRSIDTPWTEGRDLWWHDAVEGAAPDDAVTPMPAMAPALMIFTSGTTGKPKGTVHSHAGCLAQMGKEVRYNFDARPGDTFWWFSDIGWMMGPWEIIGCWVNGVCFVVFEGAPDHPAPDRVWSMVERHEVTHLGISPTAIRLLMRAGDEWVDRHPMPSLRVLGSTGEPWDPESYRWYAGRVGRDRCPVINISGGTDIVGCFLAPLPVLPIPEISLQSPGLGMDIDVFDEDGNAVVDEVGYLVCKSPAPSMTRGLWRNREKYLETYWSRFPGVWNHGDWAMVDAAGDWFLFGRADDTLKIAGRRVGPGEIEAALIEHAAVSEAAAIGVPDELKGTELVCFVVLHGGTEESESLRAALVGQVVEALGKVDRPRAILFVDDLPKTRSAKIVRRLIQRAHLGEEDLGDLASVANPEALEAIRRAR